MIETLTGCVAAGVVIQSQEMTFVLVYVVADARHRGAGSYGLFHQGLPSFLPGLRLGHLVALESLCLTVTSSADWSPLTGGE